VTTFFRIQCGLLLACLSLAANAENFKCKLPDGSTTYQDTPCTSSNATQEVVTAASGSVLISIVSELVMIGVRSGARKAEASGRMSKIVAACFNGLDNSRFYSTFQHLYSENMSAGDLKAANAFFNSPTGRKYARRLVLSGYASIGETPPEQAPVLKAAEENEVSEFVSTPVGQMLITRKFIVASGTFPAVVARIQELYKECGAKHW
jgi:hypothetical protein